MKPITKFISAAAPNSQSDIIDLTINRSKRSVQTINETKLSQGPPMTTSLPSSSTNPPQTPASNSLEMSSLPVLIAPKKSTHSFLQRFIAQNIDHQQPDCRKVATLPCDLNPEKNITLYIFKEDKRSYKAANYYGRNKYKFGAGIASYFPTVGKVPNQMKFDNDYQKQV